MVVQTSPQVEFTKTLSARPFTRRIVIHHSASSPDTTVEDIHRWHLARGWSGIGYQYYIKGDGSVWEGRPEWTQGAHAYQDAQHEANTDGIGICLGGNFEINGPTDEQMQSLALLIMDIRTRYQNIPVIGHNEVQATSCPGKYFTWNQLWALLEGATKPSETGNWKNGLINRAMNDGLLMEYHDPDQIPPLWMVLAIIYNGREKGVI